MQENEINFQNIFITEFKENEITRNLEKIALYVTGTISSDDNGIVFVDQNTVSSMIESRQQLSSIALAQEGKVLAVGSGRSISGTKKLPLEVKAGDTVIFSKYGGNEIKLDGKEYIIVDVDDVLATVT